MSDASQPEDAAKQLDIFTGPDGQVHRLETSRWAGKRYARFLCHDGHSEWLTEMNERLRKKAMRL